jgi:hypothetical protein
MLAIVNEIICKLEQLKALDPSLRNFGARAHGYALNPPLPDSAMKAVEEKYRCRLPEDYAFFLTRVGNGGAGPFAGVFPLEMQDDGFELTPWSGGSMVGDLEKPFAFTAAWNLPDEFWAQQPDPDESTTEEEEDRLWEAWDEKLSDYWAPELMNGAIPICHQGCALRIWLVVCGPAYGTVWDDSRADNEGIAPLLDKDGNFLTFKAWYLDWLDAALSAARSQSPLPQ